MRRDINMMCRFLGSTLCLSLLVVGCTEPTLIEEISETKTSEDTFIYGEDDSIYYDFYSTDEPEGMIVVGAETTPTAEGLRVVVEAGDAANISFVGDWDLSVWLYLNIEMESCVDETFRVDPAVSGELSFSRTTYPLVANCWLEPGEKRSFNIVLLPDYSTRSTVYADIDQYFEDMRGIPYGISWTWSYDLTMTTCMEIDIPASDSRREFILHKIKGSVASLLTYEDLSDFFPFIDKYGQYMHDTWAGKITCDEDLISAKIEESAYMDQFSGSEEWSTYGGYLNGGQSEATGHFRVEKIDGRWWIIDPLGYKFWSVGINSSCKLSVLTPVDGRENYFAELPGEEYFDGEEYDFGAMIRDIKYASEDEYIERSLERMRCWGFNTIGAWSELGFPSTLTESQRVPYVATTNLTTPALTSKFPDVYSTTYATKIGSSISSLATKYKDDPFFIGYFVDNEMYWYDPTGMVEEVIQLDSSSDGKSAYVDMLEQELVTISEFNSRTNSKFDSWSALRSSTSTVQLDNLSEINIAYYEQTAELYFKTIRNAIDTYSPDALYLGCRWHTASTHRNEYNVAIGAKYLDIISFNQYDNELTDETFADVMAGIDCPYLISEFNFGALDTGKFYPGLGSASDQRNRGEKFCNFIQSGLNDSRCVGAHWFMWANSTTAGRTTSGENANCGLVSEVDTPYYTMLELMREFNYNLYENSK